MWIQVSHAKILGIDLGTNNSCALFVARLRDQLPFITADATGPKHIQKRAVEGPIRNLREKLNGNDVAAIKRATEDLQNRFQSVSAELYKHVSSQTGGRSGGGAAGSAREGSTSDGSDQNVVDADFEVIDEDKKKS